jgi:hypothetical protein
MVLGTVRKTLYLLFTISLDEGHPLEKCDPGVELAFIGDTFIIATLVTGYEFDQARLIAIAEIFTTKFSSITYTSVYGVCFTEGMQKAITEVWEKLLHGAL